ncbi:MAG: hypothetical protein JRF15_16000 [Deltaproteobacteria bacterium]|jgi:hypothetical protein|nr:hypothetical protein [Deltaproteobacteria bacterium]
MKNRFGLQEPPAVGFGAGSARHALGFAAFFPPLPRPFFGRRICGGVRYDPPGESLKRQSLAVAVIGGAFSARSPHHAVREGRTCGRKV